MEGGGAWVGSLWFLSCSTLSCRALLPTTRVLLFWFWSVRVSQATNMVVCRGSEDAVNAAAAAVKAISDAERAPAIAAKKAEAAAPAAPAAHAVAGPSRAVPVGGDASYLTDAALAKMSKAARRRYRLKQERAAADPSGTFTWSDGLDLDADVDPAHGAASGDADEDATDILAQVLSRASVSAPTPASKAAAPAPAAASKAAAPAVAAPAVAAAPAVVAPAPAAAKVAEAAPAARTSAPPPGLPVPAAPTTAYRAFNVDPFALLGLTGAASASASAARPAAAPAAPAATTGRHVSSSYSVRL